MVNQQLMCSVCKNSYTDEDSVYVTSCGHIYHFLCMQSWKARSSSCPECLHHNPNTFPVYLLFDQRERRPNSVQNLEQHVHEFSELRYMLETSESNFLALQDQFTIRESEYQHELNEWDEHNRQLIESKIINISELENKLREVYEFFFSIIEPYRHQDSDSNSNSHTNEDNSELRDNWQAEKRKLEVEIQQLQIDLRNALSKQAKLSQELATQVQAVSNLTIANMKLKYDLERGQSTSAMSNNSNKIRSPVGTPPVNKSTMIPAELPNAMPPINNSNCDIMPKDSDKLPMCSRENSKPNGQYELFGPPGRGVPPFWNETTSTESLNTADSQQGARFNYLYQYAKVLRSYGFKKVYVYKQNVYARLTKHDKPIFIKDKSHVDEILRSFQN